MSKDYLSILSDIPTRHSGLLFEQLHRAAEVATISLRQRGLTLPGEPSRLPIKRAVHKHLQEMVNRALDGYHAAQERAPHGLAANEIWGEDEDQLFSVTVTGLSRDASEGFTVDIEMNLLYEGE